VVVVLGRHTIIGLEGGVVITILHNPSVVSGTSGSTILGAGIVKACGMLLADGAFFPSTTVTGSIWARWGWGHQLGNVIHHVSP